MFAKTSGKRGNFRFSGKYKRFLMLLSLLNHKLVLKTVFHDLMHSFYKTIEKLETEIPTEWNIPWGN
jgi:hypothetical protein